MARFSQNWYASIVQGKNNTNSSEAIFSKVPVMPWIHHRLHPLLVRIFLRLGLSKSLKEGERVFSSNERIDHVVLVTKGVTARAIGSTKGDSPAIALSTPGHLAAGNLNFFSGRPAAGHYFAITNAEVAYVPRNILAGLAKQDSFINELLQVQFELASLSDRVGFCCLSLLSTEDKLKALTSTWALNFGTMVFDREGRKMIRMPVPLTRKYQVLVTNCSSVWLDKVLHKWIREKNWERDGEFVLVNPELLEPYYHWLRGCMDEADTFNYPKTLAEQIFFESNLA